MKKTSSQESMLTPNQSSQINEYNIFKDYYEVKSLGKCHVITFKVYYFGDLFSIIIGPDYQGVVATLTVALLAYFITLQAIERISVGEFIKDAYQYVNFFLFISLVFFYCRCALKDPGILKADTPINPEEKTAMLCGECNLEKTKDYKHCFECGLCIHSKEVHCAWIGKCVGKNISSSFQKFNLCWLLYLGFIIFLMGNWSFFNYMSHLFGLHKKNHHKVHNDDYSDDDKYIDD